MVNTTKKTVIKELQTVTDIKGCKALLKAIKVQEEANNKVIARNNRLMSELEEEKDLVADLKTSTDIRTNWNIGLGVAREAVYDKLDELL